MMAAFTFAVIVESSIYPPVLSLVEVEAHAAAKMLNDKSNSATKYALFLA